MARAEEPDRHPGRPGLAAEFRVQRPIPRDEHQRNHRPPLPPRRGLDQRAETLLRGQPADPDHDFRSPGLPVAGFTVAAFSVAGFIAPGFTACEFTAQRGYLRGRRGRGGRGGHEGPPGQPRPAAAHPVGQVA